MRMRPALALAAGALTLGACEDMYGPYGYGGLDVGYGYGGYYAPYGYGYGPYYGGYYGGYDPFGWYGDFYYPGAGIFVYDSFRRPHRWNDDQMRYWMNRRSTWQSRTGTTWHRENWSGFNHSGTTTTTTGGHWHHRG
jgi:hypothetical protein